jgi:hypothetical protein
MMAVNEGYSLQEQKDGCYGTCDTSIGTVTVERRNGITKQDTGWIVVITVLSQSQFHIAVYPIIKGINTDKHIYIYIYMYACL